LEILRRDGSPEAQEFIYRVNTTPGFYDNSPQDCFSYHGRAVVSTPTYPLASNPFMYTGHPKISGVTEWILTGDTTSFIGGRTFDSTFFYTD
jgi:hypothetical protein